jgi:hypothetical protein
VATASADPSETPTPSEILSNASPTSTDSASPTASDPSDTPTPSEILFDAFPTSTDYASSAHDSPDAKLSGKPVVVIGASLAALALLIAAIIAFLVVRRRRRNSKIEYTSEEMNDAPKEFFSFMESPERLCVYVVDLLASLQSVKRHRALRSLGLSRGA